jgi:hypothetical protein
MVASSLLVSTRLEGTGFTQPLSQYPCAQPLKSFHFNAPAVQPALIADEVPAKHVTLEEQLTGKPHIFSPKRRLPLSHQIAPCLNPNIG